MHIDMSNQNQHIYEKACVQSLKNMGSIHSTRLLLINIMEAKVLLRHTKHSRN